MRFLPQEGFAASALNPLDHISEFTAMSRFDVTQVSCAGSRIREMMFVRRPSRPL